jgi:thiol:disulfide interchange protein
MRYKNFLLGFLLLLIFSQLSAQEADISSSYYINNKGKGILLVSYEIPTGLHQIDNRDFFTFSLEKNDRYEIDQIIYPESKAYDTFQGYEGTVTLQASLFSKDKKESTTAPVITASYQLCDETGTCFRPVSLSLTSLQGDPSLMPTESSNPVWLFLLFAFLGGIILNIMPCVLPVLSIKALHLVSQSGESRRKILIHSLLYTAGIIFSMVILAIVVVAIKASGTALGWGFQFQNPLFVLILTSLVFLFSLSLFEVFFINPPQTAGTLSSGHKGYGGSFITGIMAVLLATPCTAPLLGSALGFAFVQSGGVIILFFILIGLGLSLPFILLGFFPSLVSKLPKPGDWMNRFREFMGFLLIGTTVYLLTVLQAQLGDNFRGVLWFMLALALGAWVLGLGQGRSKRSRYLFFTAALLIPLVSYPFFIDLNPKAKTSLMEKDEEKVPFSPEKVQEIQNDGTPLFLEFTADWCATCRSNHLTVLDREYRRELFEEFGVVYMSGDYTLNDPVISEWLRRFNRAGVPLYVYYEPGKEPVVLPEVLTRSLLEKTIRGN